MGPNAKKIFEEIVNLLGEANYGHAGRPGMRGGSMPKGHFATSKVSGPLGTSLKGGKLRFVSNNRGRVVLSAKLAQHLPRHYDFNGARHELRKTANMLGRTYGHYSKSRAQQTEDKYHTRLQKLATKFRFSKKKSMGISDRDKQFKGSHVLGVK